MSLQIDEGHKHAFHVSGPRWRDNGGSSINIVLVGHAGNGKSATGNTILGGKPFKSIPNVCSVTYSCQLASKQLSDGRTINVIDTHGFSDAFSQHKQLAKCFRLVENKIYAFLLVISLRSQFSNEATSFRNLQTTFGTNFINHVIVVLTGGDDLEEENTTLADYLDNSGADPLKDIIRACGNRCILFDNRTKDERKNDEQVQSLLSLVDKMIRDNSGNHFEPYDLKEDEDHGDAIHASGPRWNENYKRAVLACFVKAAYVLELDRQEQRSAQDALAPGWWLPFKFKFLRTIIDPVDESIIGVILEWDRTDRASNILFSRPSGVPVAVLALRGTLLRTATRTRDMIYNLSIATGGSLESSRRFKGAMAELMSLINLYGSSNVCVAGHSLGGALALELAGKILVNEHKIVEVHAFNPPCPILHGIFRPVLFDQIVSAWDKWRQCVVSKSEEADQIENGETIPHVYVNTGDMVSAEFQNKPTSSSKLTLVKNKIDNMVTVKLHTVDDENKDGLVAHGIAQWWSNDLKLEIGLVTPINSTRGDESKDKAPKY